MWQIICHENTVLTIITCITTERTLHVSAKCSIQAGHTAEVPVNPSLYEGLLIYFLTLKLCDKITVSVQVRPKNENPSGVNKKK